MGAHTAVYVRRSAWRIEIEAGHRRGVDAEAEQQALLKAALGDDVDTAAFADGSVNTDAVVVDTTTTTATTAAATVAGEVDSNTGATDGTDNAEHIENKEITPVTASKKASPTKTSKATAYVPKIAISPVLTQDELIAKIEIGVHEMGNYLNELIE